MCIPKLLNLLGGLEQNFLQRFARKEGVAKQSRSYCCWEKEKIDPGFLKTALLPCMCRQPLPFSRKKPQPQLGIRGTCFPGQRVWLHMSSSNMYPCRSRTQWLEQSLPTCQPFCQMLRFLPAMSFVDKHLSGLPRQQNLMLQSLLSPWFYSTKKKSWTSAQRTHTSTFQQLPCLNLTACTFVAFIKKNYLAKSTFVSVFCFADHS